MAELAIETGTLPWDWEQADDKTLATVLEVLAVRARKMKG